MEPLKIRYKAATNKYGWHKVKRATTIKTPLHFDRESEKRMCTMEMLSGAPLKGEQGPYQLHHPLWMVQVREADFGYEECWGHVLLH